MTQAKRTIRKVRMGLICTGSNVDSAWGSPLETTQNCFEVLEAKLNTRIKRSQSYASAAYPAGSGPDFVNAAGAFETDLPADDILKVLHEVEAEADRLREVRWGPRTLDVDLIGLADVVLPDMDIWRYWADLPANRQMVETPSDVVLPHPRVQDRAFALVPLCDVAPDWVHPVLGKSLVALRDALDPREINAITPAD